MNSPLKRNSDLLKSFREEESLERKRARTSMLLASLIIKAIRVKKWNKLEFAKRMGKSPSVISRWLSGAHNFTSDTISDIEEILGVRIFNCDQSDKELTFKAAVSAGMAVNVFINKGDYSTVENTSILSLVASSEIQVVERNFADSN